MWLSPGRWADSPSVTGRRRRARWRSKSIQSSRFLELQSGGRAAGGLFSRSPSSASDPGSSARSRTRRLPSRRRSTRSRRTAPTSVAHLGRDDLGDDLPDRHVGKPFGEDLVLVDQDRDRKRQIGGGEAAQRSLEGQHSEVVEQADDAGFPVGPSSWPRRNRTRPAAFRVSRRRPAHPCRRRRCRARRHPLHVVRHETVRDGMPAEDQAQHAQADADGRVVGLEEWVMYS